MVLQGGVAAFALQGGVVLQGGVAAFALQGGVVLQGEAEALLKRVVFTPPLHVNHFICEFGT